MAVYVDLSPPGWGRWSGGGHMLASYLDELHRMAARIGLRRAWFQDGRFPHYDLTASKRRLALAAGARAIGFGELLGDVLVRRGEGGREPYAERRARREADPEEEQERRSQRWNATARLETRPGAFEEQLR